MIGDYLQRFEITTGYTSSFAHDGGLVRCDPDHIFYFKKFCDHINTDAVLRPYRYYIGHNQSGACQLEYYSDEGSTNQPNNHVFKLFYVFPYNKTHDMIRVYNQTVDFKNWNFFTDGEFVEFVDAISSNVNFKAPLMHKEPYWNTGIADFGSQNESRVFTINYPILGKYEPENDRVKNIMNSTQNENSNSKSGECSQKVENSMHFGYQKVDETVYKYGENEAWFAHSIDEAIEKSNHKKSFNEFENDNDTIIVSDVSSSFFTESLFFILKEKKNDKYNHYIITDYMYNVLIDNEMGAIFPKNFVNRSAIFPNISDINHSIWNSVVNEIISVPIDVPLLVNVSSSIQYMIIKRIIHTRSRYSFYLIMLLEMNPKISEIYSMVSNVFLICFAFLIIIFFFTRLSMAYSDSERSKKLKNKMHFFESYKKENLIHSFKGKITESIDKLRVLQLMNSDDTTLNNSIDAAVEEMTKNNEDLFDIQKDLSQSTNCPFCDHLNDRRHNLSFLKIKNELMKKKREKETYKARRILGFYLNNIEKKDSQKEKNKNDKSIYLDLKERESQLFNIWNIKMNSFLNLFSDDYLLITNPQKYLIRKFMNFIQKQNLFLVEIYPDLLLSFLLSFSKENISAYHCKIKSFKMLKRLIKHNFKFWIKSKLDIFILFLASFLRNSSLHNVDEILCLFSSFICYQNDYLLNLLRVLIDETNNSLKMEIYGMLLNRTQSPNFSVSSNVKDMILFMKAILSFVDFAPYLTKYEENKMCFIEINESIFTNEEKENQKFVSNFHFEMSKNVVFPWFNLMNSLSSKKIIINTIRENIKFWHERAQIGS